MTISILLLFYHVLPHIVLRFFNILRSFRVCVHARVFVHAYVSGRNYIHACNKKFFEGIMLVENEPPLRRKLVTGLGIMSPSAYIENLA